jgi:dGTPase
MISDLSDPPRAPAPYASKANRSRGRLVAELSAETRTAFQRDRDRVIHSAAFRRLQHKTQVFVFHEGDYYRTRLTHSLEVAQISRSICRVFGLDEDLGECLALAHDLGHTPFGHAGGDALDAVMGAYGGFNHNAQTLRILTTLEHRYAEFDGLNLTWEVLEGIAKHNGPLVGPRANRPAPLMGFVTAYNAQNDLELEGFAGPEAQAAALADDIAYNNHDIDDGLRAGLLTIDKLLDLPLVGPVFAQVIERYPNAETSRLVYESVRRLINSMVNDLIAETGRRLERAAPKSVDDIRALDYPVVAFSDQMTGNDRTVKAFLMEHLYRHERVNKMTAHAKQVVTDLFGQYMNDPGALPDDWRASAEGADEQKRARTVCDFIAGMTDRFAQLEHDRLVPFQL